MESVRCYLCDHEFVEGEEPWLMFEQRLREDGQMECSLADLLGSILDVALEMAGAHSTLLCDSCNADVLEYESMEKRLSQLKKRIMCSYKDNATIQNLYIMTDAFTAECSSEETHAEVIKYEQAVKDHNPGFVGIAECDLVEEVEDVGGGYAQEEDDLHVVGIKTENIKSIDDNFDFAAFDEHVAQHSLPPGVLNMSDGLVSLSEVQDISLEEQDIIIYDGTAKHFMQKDLKGHENGIGRGLKEFNGANDKDLNFMISPDGFDEDSIESLQDEVPDPMEMTPQDDDDDTISSELKSPKAICRQENTDFACLLCEIQHLCTRNALAEHMQAFHNLKLFMCDHCSEGFGKREDLRSHIEVGHTMECNLCNTVFTNHRLFRIHKRMHYSTTKPFECSVCQKQYGSKKPLEEHMNTHTGFRPYKCPDCPKDFASKYTLQTHMKIHKERPRPFHCHQCGKQFLNQQNLSQHKKLHVSEKIFECDICKKTFATQHSLNVHQIVHSGQKPFICRICGKSFARRPEIKDHERTHTGEKPFKCDLCPLAFAQRSNLISHKKSTHFNEKLHKCEQCLRLFKRKRLLEYHIQAAHTGERPHKCNICGAGFVYPEHYKKHMLIHSGKKPFACEVCGKQFNSRDNRNAHRFVHSDKKPYECMECGAGFMRKPWLLTHMKQTKHANDTIIVNQPQFTHHINTGEEEVNVESHALENEDIDSEFEVGGSEESLEKIILTSEEYLSVDSSVTTIRNDVDSDVIRTVDCDLIKDDLGDVKYLQFEDLEKDGHQPLTWVNVGDT